MHLCLEVRDRVTNQGHEFGGYSDEKRLRPYRGTDNAICKLAAPVSTNSLLLPTACMVDQLYGFCVPDLLVLVIKAH